MNKQLLRLVQLGEKKPRLIIGLMSGTSLDGLDIAVCSCQNEALEVLHFKTQEYGRVLRARLRSIQSKKEVSLPEVCRLNTELAHLYADWILEALKEWKISPAQIDLIASHGQTIYHAPEHAQISTLQIVDGDHIAQKTGIITISDFRQKHTAAGGQGAPIAELMDQRLFRHHATHRVLLNLGGIANFTWLPSKESGKEIISSDSGPANTLINEAMAKHFGAAFDEGGKVAASGVVHPELLKNLLNDDYFAKPFPKSTGQEDFNLQQVETLIADLSLPISREDLVATLTEFTVQSVALALQSVTEGLLFDMYVTGGGIHNAVIINRLQEVLTKASVKPFEEFGIHPDAKEAALMAFLANEMLLGNTFDVHGKRVSLGKVSLPN